VKSANDGKETGGGDTASTFSVDQMNGAGKVALQPGKVMVVDFWATWCEPCKKSFPKLQELYTKYKASGVEIAALSEDDDKGGINDFAKTYGAKFPVGWDGDKSIAKKYQPKSMPSTFIVDKKGVIKFVHTGYHDGEEAEIEKEIKSLL
jgi:thiol-disulfide isomerase/thioredoxin